MSANEAREWGLVSVVTEDYSVDGEVMERPIVKKALEYAAMVCANSPDSVIVSGARVIQGCEDGSAENGRELRVRCGAGGSTKVRISRGQGVCREEGPDMGTEQAVGIANKT